ncbi:hypothetical protein JCM10212_004972 [Sporobolomyces blumeae]
MERPTTQPDATANVVDVAALQPPGHPPTDQIEETVLPKVGLRSDDSMDGEDFKKSDSSDLEAIPATKKPLTDDEHRIPKNNMPMVLLGLALTVLLASLDSTIVSTALSTIQRDLNGTSASLAWITQAYLLTCTALAPLYGKLSVYFGRKPILFGSIVVFLFGSAMCGAAQNMVWLCACRGVQGIGGGGIIQLTQIIISDISPLATRGKYTSVIGSTWGIASAIGPLIGGVLTEKASWRWCFWINLPVGALAFAVLAYFLKLNPHNPPSASALIAEFDFLGLFLLITGLVILLFGFSSGETNWSSAETIACLSVGCGVLVIAILVELKTKRSPIIPPRLFKIRTSASIFIGTFCQSFAFMALSYYEPLYFQARGSTPLMSGVRLMPFSVGSSVVSIFAGFYVAKTRKYKPTMLVSYLIMSIGFALLATLDEKSNTAQQVLYLLVAALGCGPLFQAPYIAIQSAMPMSEMPTSTATVSLIRQIGGTVGIAVSGAMYASKLRTGLSGLDYRPANEAGAAVGNVIGLNKIKPESLRNAVIHAYTRALSDPWIVCAPLIFVGFLVSFMLKQYSLERNVVRGSGNAKDEEKGVGSAKEGVDNQTLSTGDGARQEEKESEKVQV